MWEQLVTFTLLCDLTVVLRYIQRVATEDVVSLLNYTIKTRSRVIYGLTILLSLSTSLLLFLSESTLASISST